MYHVQLYMSFSVVTLEIFFAILQINKYCYFLERKIYYYSVFSFPKEKARVLHTYTQKGNQPRPNLISKQQNLITTLQNHSQKLIKGSKYRLELIVT